MNKFKIGDFVKYVRKDPDGYAKEDKCVIGKSYIVSDIRPGCVALRGGRYWIRSHCFNLNNQMFVSDDGSFTFDSPEVIRAKRIYATIRIIISLSLIFSTVFTNLSVISSIGWPYVASIFPMNFALISLGLAIIMDTYE